MTDYYVNADTGNDSNDGLSAGSPLLTLAALAAKETSGVHVTYLTGTLAASSLDTSNARWFFSGGDTGATVDITTQMFAVNKSLYVFHNLTLNGYVNVAWARCNACVISGNNSLLAYADQYLHGCEVTGTAINIRGVYSDCVFRRKVATANNGPASFVRCRFIGDAADNTGIDQNHVLLMSYCSFINIDSVFLRSATNTGFSNCVFASYASTLTTQPSVYSGGPIGLLRGVYGYQATANAILANWHEYGSLSTPPYVDPLNDDWTVSSELAAIVTPDGFTPGAVQAVSSGTAGFTGIRGLSRRLG